MLTYTVGTWDLLHVGHLALLQYCKTLGHTVAVGVASDDVVASYKKNVPVVPLEQRMEMLQALCCVDIVRPYYELEYTSACKELDVGIFVIGEDWGKAPHNLEVEYFLKAAGKTIIQISYHPQTSSTKIKEKIIAQLHPQKPLKQAYEQRPRAVKKWLKEDSLEIVNKAKEMRRQRSTWGDECGLIASMEEVTPERGKPQ